MPDAPRFRALTPDEQERIKAAVKARCGGTYRCPMCQGESFSVDPNRGAALRAGRMVGIEILYPTRITCDQCGFIALHVGL